ncbi:MAG: hypothetical protein H0V44_03855, partial [Planctomycetes bacterium]|nr:hypothetical protein [Planctomycetota bacterium]
YPLHEQLLSDTLKAFPKAEIVWCQEEPQNMGAWHFIAPYLRRICSLADVPYAGREPAASPAPGSAALFQLEQEQLISTALGIKARALAKAHH